jgi:hypothetical protein
MGQRKVEQVLVAGHVAELAADEVCTHSASPL